MKKLIAVAFLFLGLEACKSTNSQLSGELAMQSQEFKNYSSSVVCQVDGQVVAKSVEEIQAALEHARKFNMNVRVVSLEAPRSYSPVICPQKGGLILNLKPFNRLIEVDEKSMTARVGAGMLISELQEELDKLGYTFPVTPDYNGVSIAGAMATGAHHSSLRIASDVASWVNSMRIVKANSELAELNTSDLAIGGVHLGLLGAIYELEVKILPQYKLQYGLINESDENLEERIVELVRAHDFARVMWFPSQSRFVLDYFDKVALDTPGDSKSNLWTAVPNISWLGDLPVGALNSSQFTQCSAEFARVKTFAGSFDVSNSPRNTPVGISHEMIAGGCPPGKCSWDNGIKTRTVEVGFSLSRIEEWMQDVRTLISLRKACFPVLGIYMRFSKAASSALSEARSEDTVVFEIHIPQTSKAQLEPSSEVYDEMLQMTLAKYDGRPHWAKNSLPYFTNLGSRQYPQLDQFENLRSSLDPNGLFLSPFWVSIRDQIPTERRPNCGVDRSCICETDSDCGKGARCEAGIFFKEARVCRK